MISAQCCVTCICYLTTLNILTMIAVNVCYGIKLQLQQSHVYQDISECVKLCQIIFIYGTVVMLVFLVIVGILGLWCSWWYELPQHLSQKRHLYIMFPTKCWGQDDRLGRAVISWFCQKVDVTIGCVQTRPRFSSFHLICVFCV